MRTEPSSPDPQEEAVAPVLHELTDLRADAVVAYDKTEADLADLGLDAPARWVKVDLGDGEVRELRIGTTSAAGLHVVAADSPYVFRVERARLAHTINLLSDW
jgi:hypothetical protein